ncbi:MAG: membrane associated rhomboid family serine protease [Chitinophagales bacterium]|jgi:membrane associated rhomboid family serine protease
MSVEILVYILIGANVLFSWQAFSKRSLFEKYKFRIGSILSGKEYIRMVSSAFLHADMTHLLVNMIALYSFGVAMSYSISTLQFALLYTVSLLAGNLLALFFNKTNYAYSAVGASGAVSGVVFASVLFYPDGNVLLFFIIPMKTWIFGILYLLYSVYGMNKQNDNIGHEAHLGGAVAGVLLALAFDPSLALKNWWLTAALLIIPLIIFFVKPKGGNKDYQFTILNDDKVKRTKRSVDDLYYNKEFEREKELNTLLDRVNEFGIESLSQIEKNRLQELSK